MPSDHHHHLSEYERDQIMPYRDQGLNATDIGKKLNRDWTTISKFLKDPENYGRKKRSGRPRTMDDRPMTDFEGASTEKLLVN